MKYPLQNLSNKKATLKLLIGEIQTHNMMQRTSLERTLQYDNRLPKDNLSIYSGLSQHVQVPLYVVKDSLRNNSDYEATKNLLVCWVCGSSSTRYSLILCQHVLTTSVEFGNSYTSCVERAGLFLVTAGIFCPVYIWTLYFALT